MRKQVKRNGGAGSSGLLVKALVGLLVLGLLGLGGLLLVSKKFSGQVKKGGRDRLSIMVDRMDELSQAWKQRDIPKVKSATSTLAEKLKSAPAEKAQPQSQTTAPPAPENPNQFNNSALPETKPPEHDEINPDDQKQLRGLFQKLEKQ